MIRFLLIPIFFLLPFLPLAHSDGAEEKTLQDTAAVYAPILAKLLKDESPKVRGTAARAFGWLLFSEKVRRNNEGF